MKLFLSVGPNPRVVRMALVEKGLSVDSQVVDIIKGENRQDPYLSLNPAGHTPALQLDDGRVLAESVAIVEYLDELHPTPPLLGASAEERALTRMLVRQIDFTITQPLTGGFRGAEGLGLFKDRLRCLPQAADDLKTTAREGLAALENNVGAGPYLTGSAVRLPDLLLYSFLDFGRTVGQPLDPANTKLTAWFARMGERASAKETAGRP